MNTSTRVLLPLAVIGLLGLGGCATTHFQCPTPTGVACMSAPQIYGLTNAPGKAGIEAAEGDMRDSHGHLIHPKEHDGVVSTTDLTADAVNAQPVTPLPKPGDVIPIREPARVMRIWIAPWQDASGNLHMASRVYTEIAPRQWSVGIHADQAMQPHSFFPLQVTNGAAGSASQPSNASPQADDTDQQQ